MRYRTWHHGLARTTCPRGALSTASLLLALFALSAPATALAASTVRVPLVDAKSIRLDGVPKEWPVPLSPLGYTVKGKAGKPDLEAKALIAYDEGRVYVAADVTDDALRAGADHVTLALGFPGGSVQEIELYPGDPGKSPGSVKLAGRVVAGAKVIEAPRSGGYTLEASIPWSAIPEGATVRVGLRAGLFLYDADSSPSAEAVVGSAPSAAYASLPELATEPEQALADGLLKGKGIHGAPAYNLVANVAGDVMKERVLVYERFLVVLGPGIRKGTQYYFNDMGVDAKDGMVPSLEARDVTGDGQAELVFRKRFGSGAKYREVMQVLQFGASETPTVIFQREVALSTDKGSVNNTVEFVPDGAKTAIRIQVAEGKGFDAGNYTEPRETSFDPVLLPWGTVKSQTYKLVGGVFSRSGEQTQAATPAPRPTPVTEAPARPAPKGPSRAALLEQVYSLYKRDRSASGRPRFDLAADLAGSREVERVLLHDRDIVVFGKGFKGGTGYSFLTLAQFASPDDIREVSARDLTGDGKAEIIVHGTVHAPAPKEAGGGTVDRDVVLVLQVAGEAVKRVFAAELSRSLGSKKVTGELRFARAGDTVAIELAPGRAIEWTDKTYPFNQDTGPVGGFEPLLLPWSGITAVRYTWNGTSFAK